MSAKSKKKVVINEEVMKEPVKSESKPLLSAKTKKILLKYGVPIASAAALAGATTLLAKQRVLTKGKFKRSAEAVRGMPGVKIFPEVLRGADIISAFGEPFPSSAGAPSFSQEFAPVEYAADELEVVSGPAGRAASAAKARAALKVAREQKLVGQAGRPALLEDLKKYHDETQRLGVTQGVLGVIARPVTPPLLPFLEESERLKFNQLRESIDSFNKRAGYGILQFQAQGAPLGRK